MSLPVFKRSVRGFDASDVETFVADLVSQKAQLDSDLAEVTRSIQRATRELSETKRNKPSFAELGSAFEETLRLAEAQAEKIVQDASYEAETITKKAQIRASELAEARDRDAALISLEAKTAADDLRLANQRDLAIEHQHLAEERHKIESIVARGERASTSLLSDAENHLAQLRLDVQRSAQELVDEANDVLRQTNELRSETELRVQEELNDAQRSATSVHDEADRYAAQAHEQADAFMTESVERAASATREADEQLRLATERADEIIQSAKEYADRIVSAAISRSREIVSNSDAILGNISVDAELRVGEARSQKSAVADFSHKQNIMTNALGLTKINPLLDAGTQDDTSSAVTKNGKSDE